MLVEKFLKMLCKFNDTIFAQFSAVKNGNFAIKTTKLSTLTVFFPSKVRDHNILNTIQRDINNIAPSSIY